MSSLATSSPVSASTRPVFNAVASVSVDLIEADLFGIGGGRVQRDRTGDEGQTKEIFPIGSRGHTQNSASGAARIQDDRERLVPTSRLVPLRLSYLPDGRCPGRGERHRLNQPIRLPIPSLVLPNGQNLAG